MAAQQKRVAPSEAGKGKQGTGSQWGLSADEVNDFLFRGKVLSVSSSNLEAAQFLAGENKLIVKYLGDGHYEYDGVTEGEALAFANAPSKGVFVWDHLRVRGSKTAHRKAFKSVSGFRTVSPS